jgi:hypothetical protein
MPFVGRDSNGNINGLFANAQDFTNEFLPDNDPSVIAFLNPPVTIVTMRQARLALIAAGLYDKVNTAINASDESTQVWWEYSTNVERNNSILNAMATQLSLTSAQVDGLFQAAANL